ncbi:MAG TPA: flagellar type III secretion system pore protein FliP [Bryobacteraceae bacterium]|nr:flagellar type III secretion system pore protein FliP [Bryobacteraceae bacterium]
MKLARCILTLWLATPGVLRAQSPGSLLGVSLTPSKGSASLGVPMQIILVLTLLAVLPAVVMTVTPFLRITVVLHFLRQALGTQTTPSNQVLIGLSLFLTLLIMQPVVSEMYHKGWEPLEQGKVQWQQAFDDGSQPLRTFLVRYVREKDVRLFLEVSHTPAPARPSDLSLSVLLPAYVLSELKTGFQIGAVLYLPFLVIDLVVASVTLSIGMVQLPPVMLSAPFKILLFVLVDGWNLVVGSLVRSFYQT